MRIGVLGTGNVGHSLGDGFVSRGHEVMMGSRDPASDTVRAFVDRHGGHATGGTFAEAAEYAELAVLALLWTGAENALRLAGPERLAGKVVIDATNPLLFEAGRPPRLERGHTDSGGEQVQRWLPDARVVKCFNIVGHAHMVDPDFPCGPPDMFLCGNDADAKATVTAMCRDFGWRVMDVGGIEGARLLEPLCILWVLYGTRRGDWNNAFRVLTK